MTDQIPAEDVREIAEKMRYHASQEHVRRDAERYFRIFAKQLDALLSAPPRPTLADIPPEERAACRWMQADIESEGRAIILLPNASGGRAVLLDRWGGVIYEDHASVTPRPDLPRMEWPGDQKPAPAPALPDGWRLADHKDNGRVIVTNPTPSSDGRVYYVLPSAECMGFDWLFCDHSELTYIDSPSTKEIDTPTGSGHLAVGTVIESADDPRLDALPVGSILIDRDEDATIKGRGEWTGAGYIPIPSEYGMFAPWTVLHIPKEKA